MLSRKIALRLVALFPMHKREKKIFHALNWFERGVADEVSIRNILRGMSRDPRFATRSDLLAAMLRQGATQEEIDTLPLCEKQPMRALDNLVMQLPWLGAWLQKKYPMPKGEPTNWYPGLWDYFFHRRFITPWRKALRSAAEDDEKERARMIQFLSSLGDAENVERLSKGRESVNDENAKRKAERIRWQLKDASFEAFEADWRDVCRDEIDASLVHAALRYLSSLKQSEQDDEECVTRALTIVLSADLPNWIKLGVIEAVTKESIPGPLIVALRESEVHDRRLYHEVSPALILRLWEEASLRSFIALDLGKMYGNGTIQRYLRRIKRAASEEEIALSSSFLSAWAVSLNTNQCLDELLSGCETDALQEIARALIEHDEVDVWVRMYSELPDAQSASWFLAVLKEQPSLPVKKIEEALKSNDGTTWDDRTMRHEWLQEFLR